MSGDEHWARGCGGDLYPSRSDGEEGVAGGSFQVLCFTSQCRIPSRLRVPCLQCLGCVKGKQEQGDREWVCVRSGAIPND